MTNKETLTIEGTVVRILQPQHVAKNGKKWTINKFVLKTLNGADYFISKFGPFEATYIGKDVRFEATKYNDTNYTVVGEVEDAGDLVASNVPATQATPPASTEQAAPVASSRRRGRPSKSAEALTPTPAPATTKVHVVSATNTGRDSFVPEALSSVINNLRNAQGVLTELKYEDYTVADLVAVADLIGRTTTAIFMDAQKDNRMARFNK